jgi:uncharacterized phage-associated protein
MRARYGANMAKALEVVLWLANERPSIDFHKLLKLLFFADKYHLNLYGRPIVGGMYYAAEYGPLNLPVYDILTKNPLAVEVIAGSDDVCDADGLLAFNVESRYRVVAQRKPDSDLMSESDVEALKFASDKYGDLSFDDLTEASHAEPAYRKADGGQMSYEDFLDESPDKRDKAADLAEASRYVLL